VQTAAATGITVNSATLNGSITSSGAAITEYGFLWGTSSSSLSNTLQVGADNHSGGFTASLGSLTAGTAYYVQAYAKNSYGTAKGAVMHFTTAAAVPPPVPAPIFSDVPASFWGYGAITSLSTMGYVYGYPDGVFQPNSQITRAEVAAIMDKVLNLAPYTPQSPTFTDVKPDDWFYQAVETANHAGIEIGYHDGAFHPNAPISRQEIACVLVQALGKSQLADSNAQAVTKFLDDRDIAWWSRGFIYVALQEGIVRGYPDNTYRPENMNTRAEACAMIEKFLGINSK
jgi:hypothetical protein